MNDIKVFSYEVQKADGTLIVDTKICYSNLIRALNTGRSLLKEYRSQGAAKVRVENVETWKTYWV